MKKRIWILMIALLCTLMLAACGKDSDDDDDGGSKKSSKNTTESGKNSTEPGNDTTPSANDKFSQWGKKTPTPGEGTKDTPTPKPADKKATSTPTPTPDPIDSITFGRYDRNREITDTFTTTVRYYGAYHRSEYSLYTVTYSVSDLGLEHLPVKTFDYEDFNLIKEADFAVLDPEGANAVSSVKRYCVANTGRNLAPFYLISTWMEEGREYGYAVQYKTFPITLEVADNYDSWDGKKLYEDEEAYIDSLKKEIRAGIYNAQNHPDVARIELDKGTVFYEDNSCTVEYVTFNGIPGTINYNKKDNQVRITCIRVNGDILEKIYVTVAGQYRDFAVDVVRNFTWSDLKGINTLEDSEQNGIYRALLYNDYLVTIKYQQDKDTKNTITYFPGQNTYTAENSYAYSHRLTLHFEADPVTEEDFESLEKYNDEGIYVRTLHFDWYNNPVNTYQYFVKLPKPLVRSDGSVCNYLVVYADWEEGWGDPAPEELLDILLRTTVTVDGTVGNDNYRTDIIVKDQY